MTVPGSFEGIHCADNSADRALGKLWEIGFCNLAARFNRVFTPHQIGRPKSAAAYKYYNGWHPLTLPDVTVWSAPTEHHEIKHKCPTDSGCYGLEEYRIIALKWFADETQHPVFYTIHNHGGDRDARINRPRDWFSANVNELWDARSDGRAVKATLASYVAGKRKTVVGWYWPIGLWHPLVSLWR